MKEHKALADLSRSINLYGLLAEFDDPKALLIAAQRTYAAGYRRIDAFTPQPVEGLSQTLGFSQTRLPLVVLTGGIVGCLTGYFIQYLTAVEMYPLNVGGRPVHSWPAFVPVTFEVTVLFAALAAVLGMLSLNGLPTPHHPVFNAPQFIRASRDRFFLCIKTKDERFDRNETRRFLARLSPIEVIEIER